MKILDKGGKVLFEDDAETVAETVQAAVASRANLSGAILCGVTLNGPNLKGAALSGADLRLVRTVDADLSGADLSAANLQATDLSGAILNGVDLGRADLSGADLRGADLTEAILYSAILRGTRFSGADISAATFNETMIACDLSGAANLESISHLGPSTVALETLRAFQGAGPEVFLRGCGLTPWEIESAKLYDPDLTAVQIEEITRNVFDTLARSPIQRHSIFLSYAHDDAKFVDRLQQRMYAAGLNCWRDIHDASAGRLDRVVTRAIGASDIVLPILSANSVHKPWLQFEVERAVQRQIETGEDVLCPISLDDTWIESDRMPGQLLTQLKQFVVLPFEDWEDDDTFETMYRRLQRGIVEFYPFSPSGDDEGASG